MMDNSEHIGPPHQRGEREDREPARSISRSRSCRRGPHRRDRDHGRSRQPLDPGIARGGGGSRPRSAAKDDHPARSRNCRTRRKAAVEQSTQSASAAVSEIQETQNMLRSDTTALYERLARGPNILLQEVLRLARHENMSDIESTLVAPGLRFRRGHERGCRAERPARPTSDVERNIASFKAMSLETLNDLSQLAGQFDHARTARSPRPLALIDNSNPSHRGRACRTQHLARGTGRHARRQGHRARRAADPLSRMCSINRSKVRRNGRADNRPTHCRRRHPAASRRSPRISTLSATGAEEERQRLAEAHAQHLRAGIRGVARDALARRRNGSPRCSTG